MSIRKKMDTIKKVQGVYKKHYKSAKWMYYFFIKYSGLHHITSAIEDLVNYHPLNKSEKKGWSFVLKTSGDNEYGLIQVIKSIEREFVKDDNYEILIIGNVSDELKNKKIKHCKIIGYKYLPITMESVCVKYKIGARIASYDKVVMAGNSVALCDGWKKAMDDFGDNWNVCTNKELDFHGNRAKDWIVWDYPGIGRGWLPYEVEHSKYQYLHGRYSIVKRNFYRKHPHNRKIYVIDYKYDYDVDWSLSIRDITKIRLNRECYSKTIIDRDQPHGTAWVENSNKIEELFKCGKLE